MTNLKFNRMEFAGSFGDLGTLFPLAAGMILINGLNPTGLFFTVGIFYICSGFYFRVTSPVEPMKIISGYAIATGISAIQIQASCLWISIILMVIGATGLIDVIGRHIQRPVIRGVQLSTGILLLSQGIKLIIGTSPLQQVHQAAEPFLAVQSIGPVPVGIILGSILGIITLTMLENRKIPAALVVVGAGLLSGMLLGKLEGWEQVTTGINMPSFFPYGLPAASDFVIALTLLAIPQIPMTIGNAVVANADLSAEYFADMGHRVTYKALCISMALANFLSFIIGGMPVCHGAGGLASRYRFGARTGGSNLIIGMLFLLLAIIFGEHILLFINLIPLAVLGVLLLFAGVQLSLAILDIRIRKDMFVTILVVGITMASNLAAGFVCGIIVAAMLKWKRFSV